ncbi:MAG TPA: hypothetical protein VGY55_12675 [Pirellulales bacterium]|jgi:hypothetical protein|nr:hypothetical protein [Pirellulales bacterium]
MVRGNKAHTTTVNRIVRRYNGKSGLDVDVETPEGIVEVETEATIGRGIRQLKKFHGPVYLAVTNREALPEALRATKGSRIGVMDPHGNIVKPSDEEDARAESTSEARNGSKRTNGDRRRAIV